jgi:putative exosortase-associated protein (TIGR04073 family)
MQKWFYTLGLGFICAAATIAGAQTTSTTEQTYTRSETRVSAAPNPLAEKQDRISADKNTVVEDKQVVPADHDYMPSPATVPQADMRVEETHGAPLGEVPPREVLITTTAYSVTPSSTKGPFYDVSENELRARKFCRGAGNVVLSVAEIPNQMFQEAYRTSPITGAVVGAGKGAWKGAKRLMIGSWEMVTFFHPGENHYQPYIEPEVVFQEYLH